MDEFRNILVGVDINASGELAEGAGAAIAQARLIAQETGAAISFVHVIDVPAEVGEVMSLQPQSAVAARQRDVSGLLDELASDTRASNTRGRVLFGTHWRALLDEVQHEQHDLVVIGTRGRGVAGRALFGSTGNRLLRHCPCTVWVVKPCANERYANILVAHDLSPVGDAALRLGACIANIQNSRLHVLHVLEYPEEARFLGSITAAEIARREAEARDTLVCQCRNLGLKVPAEIVIANGSAHTEILNYVGDHGSDLLCMGTLARSGVPGLVTGNTAENVLPWVKCSLIALKPEGFVSLLKAHERA
jgi:nucleotide-binding universal stress UspA family protein